MKSSALEPNQHLNREQVLETFKALGYSPENIVSKVDIEGFVGAEISSPEALNQAIQDVLSKTGDKNHQLILFRVGAESRDFAPNEGENNHYVALHFAQDGANLRLTYIDPTGAEIAQQVREIIASSSPSLAGCAITSSKTSLQFTNPVKGYGIRYQMGGNDLDCGVIVALAADMVRRNYEGRDQVRLSESSSRQLGQTLRQLTSGEKKIEDVGQDITNLLSGRERTSPKVPTILISQEQQKEHVMSHLLALYSLPDFTKFTAETRPKTPEREVKTKELHQKLVDYHKLYSTEDSPVPEVNRLDLAKYYRYIREQKDFLIERINNAFQGKLIFRIVGEIAERVNDDTICEQLSLDMASKLAKDTRIAQHLARMSDFIPSSEFGSGKKFNIIPNKNAAANDGFVAVNQSDPQDAYYIKTFSKTLAESTGANKLDCREPFLYKVLELTDFGPQTEFMLQKFSSGIDDRGSSFIHGNYIVTKSLSSIGSKEADVVQREFFADGDDSDKAQEVFREAFQNRDFMVRLYTLAALNNIFLMHDTFGENYGNYGVVKTVNHNGEVEYHPKVLDHLPITSNGILRKDYSPGRGLVIKSLGDQARPGHSSLKSFMEELQSRDPDNKLFFSSEAFGLKSDIAKLFHSLDLDKVLDFSNQLIERKVEQIPQVFTESTRQDMDQYLAKIKQNLEIFRAGYLDNAPSTAPKSPTHGSLKSPHSSREYGLQ